MSKHAGGSLLAEERMPGLLSSRDERTRPAAAGLPSAGSPWMRSIRWASAHRLTVVLCAAVLGLLSVAHANNLSRSGATGGSVWFWAGLLAMLAPIAWVVCSATSTRTTRVASLVLLSMAYEVARLFYSPGRLFFFDEFSHLTELKEVLRTGHALQPDVLLPSAGWYPGLSSVTAATVQLTGLDAQVAALAVIAAARCLVLVAVFLLLEKLLGSARTAGLATLLYAANPNFFYWSNQFAYESLALPLAFAGVALLVCSRDAGVGPGRTFAVFAVVASAVIVTHHLTAWLVAAFVLAIYAAERLRRDEQRETASRVTLLWGGAYLGLGSLAFAVLVAPGVFSYVFPVLGQAVAAGWQLLITGRPTRHLSTSAGVPAPVFERILSYSSVLLLAIPVVLSLCQFVRRRWRVPQGSGLVLSVMAVLSVLVLPLRLTVAGQETANRSADYLYVGAGALAAVVWLGRSELGGWIRQRGRHRLHAVRMPLLSFSCVVILAGGVALGSAFDQRLAENPSGHGVPLAGPEVANLAEYMGRHLGRGNRVVTDRNSRQVLGVYGQHPLSGLTDAFPAWIPMLPTKVDAGLVDVMRAHDVEYVAVERRLLSARPSGMPIYFDLSEKIPGRLPRASLTKWDTTPGVSRVFDNGTMQLYDVRRLRASGS